MADVHSYSHPPWFLFQGCSVSRGTLHWIHCKIWTYCQSTSRVQAQVLENLRVRIQLWCSLGRIPVLLQ